MTITSVGGVLPPLGRLTATVNAAANISNLVAQSLASQSTSPPLQGNFGLPLPNKFALQWQPMSLAEGTASIALQVSVLVIDPLSALIPLQLSIALAQAYPGGASGFGTALTQSLSLTGTAAQITTQLAATTNALHPPQLFSGYLALLLTLSDAATGLLQYDSEVMLVQLVGANHAPTITSPVPPMRR